MEVSNFFISALADTKQSFVEAEVPLPLPFDSRRKYEVALVYCTFSRDWGVAPLSTEREFNLHMTYIDTEANASEKILFNDIPQTAAEEVGEKNGVQLEQLFGSNMAKGTAVKLAKNRETKSLELKLAVNSELILSPDLAELLGLYEEIVNTTNMPLVLEVVLEPEMFAKAVDTDVYYITCDELAPNLVSHRSASLGVLDFVYAPYAATKESIIQHYPNSRVYHSISDESHPLVLHFRVLNGEGDGVQVKTPQLFLLLHVRSWLPQNIGGTL